jgi:putative PIN family toxin of toxin-antitoxin system
VTATALRLVLDTNVLISALWTPGSVPALAIDAIFAHDVRVLYDARILAEYRTVLSRPKFKKIDPVSAAALIASLVARGERMVDVGRWPGALKDEDDRSFVEVALSGRANVLVTGNLRDYPQDLGFEVLPPAMLLGTLAAMICPRSS